MAGVGATERSWIRVWSGTWNVFSSNPPATLNEWLGLRDGGDLCDIYVVGLQEANANPIAWTTEFVVFDPWTLAISRILCKRGLTRLFVRRVLGLLICVFVRVDLLPWVSHLEFAKIRTSMTGKGSIAVRFRLCDIHMVFINCHFCAHAENISVRNREYFRSISHLRFTDPECQELLKHHYAVWMGDFNYRLDKTNTETVRKAIAQNDIATLRQYDQLTREKDLGYVFNDFNEGIINFPPTYKFRPNSQEYDFSSQHRLPSWCDRIQWKICPPSDGDHRDTHGTNPSLQLLSYESFPSFINSDHKPISSIWLMALPSLHTQITPISFALSPSPLSCDAPAMITYDVQECVATTKWDWIGLYKIGWQWQKDYVTYVWASQDISQRGNRTRHSVVINPQYLPKHSGQYQLVYYHGEGAYHQVLGVSRMLEILCVKETVEDVQSTSLSVSSSDSRSVVGMPMPDARGANTYDSDSYDSSARLMAAPLAQRLTSPGPSPVDGSTLTMSPSSHPAESNSSGSEVDSHATMLRVDQG